ncbi:MAG: EamA family transporter, partial [Thermoplasmata archaeon]|nr:EamA family transporter [Thermoplasmata archaeon]
MIEIWLILALSAVVMYGVSQAAIKVALREISAPTFILATVFMTFPTYLVILIGSIAVGRYGNIDFEHFIYLILAAAFGQIGYYVYLEAAESGPISIVGSITAAYPIMVIMFAIVFLAEILTAIQAVGVGMITIGMIVLSYFHGSSENKSHLSRKCFTLCIITLLLWGFWAIFTKLSLEQVDPIFFLGFYVFIIPPVTIIYFKRNRISPKKIWPKWTVPVIIAI